MSTQQVIHPTIGRQVWLWIDHEHKKYGQPFAATVVHVNSLRDINVHALDGSGQPAAYMGITLVQPGDKLPLDGAFCEWMPYQIEQASKDGGIDGVGAAHAGGGAADEQVGCGSGSPDIGEIDDIQPHQKRVVEEFAALADKILSLSAFMCGDIFKNLAPIERMMLDKQMEAMRKYAYALECRLALWGIVRQDA